MANGLFAGGSGTELSPFLIEDAHDLNAIRNNLTGYYKLINDIDLDILPYNVDEGWLPISIFNGYLDGNGFTISNLFINRPSSDDVGLFGQTGMNLKIKNFELYNFKIVGNNNVGGLIGRTHDGENQNGYCKNIVLVGEVIGNSSVGGAFGLKGGVRYAPPTLFSNLKVKVKVAGNINVGGIVGNMPGSLASQRNNYMEKVIYETPDKNQLYNYNLLVGTLGSLYSISDAYVVTNNKSNLYSASVLLSYDDYINKNTFNNLTNNAFATSLNDFSNPLWIIEDYYQPRLYFEKLRLTKTLIKSNNALFSWIDNEFVPVDEPSLINFMKYGMDSTDKLATPSNNIVYDLLPLRLTPHGKLFSRKIIPKKWDNIQNITVK